MIKNIILLCFTFIFCTCALFAQETTLLYKEKKTFPPSKEKIISIRLCNSEGLGELSMEEFNVNDTMYFCYQPMGTWDFKAKELDDDIAAIKIIQNETIIPSEKLTAHYDKNEKISEVVAAFPWVAFVRALPFAFSNDLGVSQPLTLPEKFWPNYDVYSNAYTNGADLAEQQKYIESFSVLKCFLSSKPEVEGLSFLRLALQLIKNDVEIPIEKCQSEFNILKLDLMKSLDESILDQLDNCYTYTHMLQDSFAVYFDHINSSESTAFQDKLNTLVQESGELLQQYTDEFKFQKLTIFEKGHYSDNKYAFYIDLLSRMLCYSDSIHTIDSLHPIDIKSVTSFPVQRDRLELLEWFDNFMAGISLINTIIEKDHYVLGDSAMINLKAQTLIEKQPYYEIISAFNALGSKNIDAFVQNISAACIKCTDEQLLDLLELQYLSYFATSADISGTVIEAINQGLAFERQGKIPEAEQQYTKASILASNYAPPQFYLGRIYHKKDEKYTAEIYFDRALEISPTYISPLKYMIDFLIEEGSYQEALDLANKALASNPIWFFYYLKSLALYHLGHYSEAGNSLNDAIELNGFNFDEYILLGDIFKAQENLDRAREAYSNAGKIDPTNKIFTERMTSLRK